MEENEVEYPDIKILDEQLLWITVSILDVELTFASYGEVLSSNNMLALQQHPLKYGLTKKNKKLQDLFEDWKKRAAAREAPRRAVNDALKRSGQAPCQ